MINDFEEQIFEWLYKCPDFNSLYLLFADLTNQDLEGQVVIAPEFMGTDNGYVKRYMRDDGIKQYVVNIAQYLTLISAENKNVNAQIIEHSKKVQFWIMQQIEDNNLPDIGYKIKKIEVTPLSQAGIDEIGGTKLQFQMLIDYHFKKGVI